MFAAKFQQKGTPYVVGAILALLLSSKSLWTVAATGTQTTPQPAISANTPTPSPLEQIVGQNYKGTSTLSPLVLLHSVEGVDQTYDNMTGAADVGLTCSPTVCVETTNVNYALIASDGQIRDTGYSVDLFRPLLLPNSGPGDTRPVYDPSSNRFFISSMDDPRTCKANPCETYYLLAVSADSNPYSFKTGWNTYRTNASQENGKDTGTVPDFNSFAAYQNAVVVTSHVMTPQEGNLYEKVRILPKSSLLDGSDTVTPIDLVRFSDPTGKQVLGAIQPVIEQDAQADTPVYLLSTNSCSVYVWRISNLQQPKLEVRTAQATFCADPSRTPQLNAPPLSVAGGSVIQSQPVYRNGHIWGAQQIGMGNGAAIRWFQIDVSAWPKLTFIQDGRLSKPNEYLDFPALAVDEQENMALIFGQSSSQEYPSLWITGRRATDPSNTVRPPILLHQSSVSLNNVEHPNGEMGYTENRYGDFFNCSIDFAGGFWCAGEYVKKVQLWGTWIGHVSVPSS